MSEYYDVVVAGGGPAGLSIAREVSKEGIDVLLLELQSQIGSDSPSSIWVGSKFDGDIFAGAVKSSVDRVKLNSLHREIEIEGDFGKIIDKEYLDKTLAKEAVKSGVDIWVSSPVKGFLESKDTVSGVRTEAGDWKEDIESKIVVDATGAKAAWSGLFLRKILGEEWSDREVPQVNEYLMANADMDEEVSIYFNSILAPGGYAWIYPDKKDFAVTGIRGVRIHPDSALDEFLGREDPVPLKNSMPIGAWRGKAPIESLLSSAVSDGIISVGSSAGHVYPFSGHGLKYALKVGDLASRIICEAIREGDTSGERLSEYDDLWRGNFEKEIRIGKILRESFEVSTDKKMDSVIDLLEDNSELQNYFMNLFLARGLEKSLNVITKNNRFREILGEKQVKEIFRILK